METIEITKTETQRIELPFYGRTPDGSLVYCPTLKANGEPLVHVIASNDGMILLNVTGGMDFLRSCMGAPILDKEYFWDGWRNAVSNLQKIERAAQ